MKRDSGPPECLLFLDVDGVLLPFGGEVLHHPPQPPPDANPLLARADPADRRWVAAHHPAPALLHAIDPARGLSEEDFAAIRLWLRSETA